MSPLVSVVMPCFNAETYLAEAIDSMLGQSHRNLELIIVDDGSTDRTPALLAAISDPRVVVLRNERNLGVVGSLNRGFENARGEFIARMDADDVSLPDRLHRQVCRFLETPELGVLGTGVTYIDPAGQTLRSPRLPPQTPAGIHWRLLFSNCIHHPTVMFRKSMQALPMYSAQYPDIEDWELWLRLCRTQVFGTIPERLVKHRRHGASVSAQRQHVQRESVAQLIREHAASVLGVTISLDEARGLQDPGYWCRSSDANSRSPLQVLASLREGLYGIRERLTRSERRECEADMAFFAMRSGAAAAVVDGAAGRRATLLYQTACAVICSPLTALRNVALYLD